jgi:hypothetical protein
MGIASSSSNPQTAQFLQSFLKLHQFYQPFLKLHHFLLRIHFDFANACDL